MIPRKKFEVFVKVLECHCETALNDAPMLVIPRFLRDKQFENRGINSAALVEARGGVRCELLLLTR